MGICMGFSLSRRDFSSARNQDVDRGVFVKDHFLHFYNYYNEPSISASVGQNLRYKTGIMIWDRVFLEVQQSLSQPLNSSCRAASVRLVPTKDRATQ